MRYFFPQYFKSASRFLSYSVVARALLDAGHELCETADGADAVLFSICDATEFRSLVRCRNEHDGIPLIVGGAFAFNFWACILYADYVWVGEVYEMAECQSLSDYERSPHCYVGGSQLPVSSIRIDWERVPVAQIAPKKCYYWGGNGCKNKCRFCYASWTRPHSQNSAGRIAAARRACDERKVHLMIASNEYEWHPGVRTFDMLLTDYLKTPVKGSVLRCGVEFATEESRRWMGKAITKNEIFHAIQKAQTEGVTLKLFHISGYDALEDWDGYIWDLCEMVSMVGYSRLLQVEFNNLQYQNYTPRGDTGLV